MSPYVANVPHRHDAACGHPTVRACSLLPETSKATESADGRAEKEEKPLKAPGVEVWLQPQRECGPVPRRKQQQQHPQCTQCRTGHWSVSPRSGTAVPSAQNPCGTECPVPGQCPRLALHSVQQCRPVPQIRPALSAQCRMADSPEVPPPADKMKIAKM